MPTPEEIIHHDETPSPDGADPWVGGGPSTTVEVVPPDPSWPAVYRRIAAEVVAALGDGVREMDHVGSTSVPGLPAKPIIDVALVVADSADEAAYLPALQARGFVLRVREPWWHEHRMLWLDDPRCNLHVFGHGAPEPIRNRMFRDWLREHPEDRDRYARVKLAAAAESASAGEHVMQYNERKAPVIREIYDRAFRAAGLL